MPAAAEAMTAAMAPGASEASEPPVAPQFGRPSVASRMNFGLGSARLCRYCAPVATAVRVGVRPFGFVIPIDAAMAAALLAAIGTAVPIVAHVLLLGKYFRPHRICACVVPTTMLIAAVMSGHFGMHAPPIGQSVPSACWAI